MQNIVHCLPAFTKVCFGQFLEFWPADTMVVGLVQPRLQSPPASFDVTSPTNLVGRTRLGRMAINGKFKMAELGSDLVPSEELQEYVPLTVTGDGSCLFRALSALVCCDETKSVEFRIRCVIELALNSTY